MECLQTETINLRPNWDQQRGKPLGKTTRELRRQDCYRERLQKHFQVVSTLLKLPGDSTNNFNLPKLFAINQQRLAAITIIYEQLYQSKSLNRINFCDYITQLIESFFQGDNDCSERLFYQVSPEPIFLDVERSIFCGLIANELISNTLKYCLASGESSCMWVHFYRDDTRQVKIVIRTNIGNYKWENIDALGFQLVKTLTQKMAGSLRIYSQEFGSTVQVKIPEINYRKQKIVLL